MTGVPVTGAAQPLRVKIPGTGAKGLGHLGAAEIALADGTSTRVFTPLKTLDGGMQRVFTLAIHQLRDQRSEPVRRFSQHLSMCPTWRVEGRVTGTQKRQASVAGRFCVSKRKQSLGKGAVGNNLGLSHCRE
jgi:hypothetical protein